MKRSTFVSLAAALSLLVCAVILGLWVRSAWGPAPAVTWGDAHGAVGRTLSVSRGAIDLRSEWSRRPMVLNVTTRAMQVTLTSDQAPGFARSRTMWIPQTIAGGFLPGNFGTMQETRVSLAWPLLLSVMTSIGLVARAVRLRRRVPGLCRCCGYDLRATPGRCPECGMRVGGGDVTRACV